MKQTQIESWIKTKEIMNKRYTQILNCLANGQYGKTIHDIEKETQLKINCISGRLSELENKNIIKPIGKIYYKPTNRNITLWGFNYD